MIEAKERRQCMHLRTGDGDLPKHATATLRSVPPEENTTEYSWDIEVELCTLCSGYVRAIFSNVIYKGVAP